MIEVNSSISVVIATLNEEEGIGPTIGEMQRVLTIVHGLVDGNSVDRTIEIAKNMGADVLLQEAKAKEMQCSRVEGLSSKVHT